MLRLHYLLTKLLHRSTLLFRMSIVVLESHQTYETILTHISCHHLVILHEIFRFKILSFKNVQECSVRQPFCRAIQSVLWFHAACLRSFSNKSCNVAYYSRNYVRFWVNIKNLLTWILSWIVQMWYLSLFNTFRNLARS